MTLVCLGYRKGFVEAARQRGLALHFIVEKMKSGLSGLSCTKVADLADTEEVLRAALAAVGTGITGVVTGHEQALFTAAALRSALKLPGDTHLLRCLRFRDKQIQKQSLSAAVPRARCTYLPRENPSFARLAEQLDAKGRPVVVKPADGHGAQATRLVSGQTELDAYVSQFPVRSDVQTVAECFVEGEEIHVDGIWSRGEPRWLSVSTYLGPLMGWHEGAAIGDAPLGGAEPELDARARRFATQVLTELDAPDTVFHLEAFVRPDGELVLGEVAARMVGALTAEVLELTYGIDLYGAAVDLALGRTPATLAEPAGPHGPVRLRLPHPQPGPRALRGVLPQALRPDRARLPGGGRGSAGILRPVGPRHRLRAHPPAAGRRTARDRGLQPRPRGGRGTMTGRARVLVLGHEKELARRAMDRFTTRYEFVRPDAVDATTATTPGPQLLQAVDRLVSEAPWPRWWPPRKAPCSPRAFCGPSTVCRAWATSSPCGRPTSGGCARY